MIRKGRLRGEKKQYPDGVSCCVWLPFEDGEEDVGLCWDFAFEDIEDLIALLQEMRDAPIEEAE